MLDPVPPLQEDFISDHDVNMKSWMALTSVHAGSMSYPHYRNSPIFEAKPAGVSTFDRYSLDRYFNNGTKMTKIACIDQTQTCDLYEDKCWWWFPAHNDPVEFLRSRNHRAPRSNGDPALVLLEASLAGSSICSVLQGGRFARHGLKPLSLEAESHCTNLACDDLPDDQWKIEVRRWFETSLARVQLNVLDIVRPSTIVEDGWANIPSQYRSICHVGKFKATGWRNVSAWGFLGLLGLAGRIALASCETERGDLWIGIAAETLWCCLRKLMFRLRTIRLVFPAFLCA